VTFAVTGLPASITATFNPATTAGTQSVLSISVAAGTGAQTFTGTVLATADGVPSQSATLQVNVVASATNIVWRFCGPRPAPVFFTYIDGLGPYTVVSPAGDGSYTISLASGRGVVTFTVPEFAPPEEDGSAQRARLSKFGAAAPAAGPGATTHVYYGSTSELQVIAAAQCQAPVVTKTVFGSVAGVPADLGYGVIFGTTLTYSLAGGPATFTLHDVPDGVRDLIGARLRFTATPEDDFAVVPDRFIVRRGVNPPAGSTLPVLDFGSTEAFDVASATITLTGTNGARVETSSIIATANGSMSEISLDPQSASTARTWYGLPASRLIAGDLQAVSADDDRGREVISYGREVVAKTVAFGPTMAWPDVSVYTVTPTLRVRAVVNVGAPTTQYGGMLEATFVQPALQRAIIMHYAKTALSATNFYELRTPAMAGLAGWNESLYGLLAGSPLEWTIESFSEWMFTPAEGAVLRTTRAHGTLVP
jgi:hypothetical protein